MHITLSFAGMWRKRGNPSNRKHTLFVNYQTRYRAYKQRFVRTRQHWCAVIFEAQLIVLTEYGLQAFYFYISLRLRGGGKPKMHSFACVRVPMSSHILSKPILRWKCHMFQVRGDTNDIGVINHNGDDVDAGDECHVCKSSRGRAFKC